MGTERRSVLAPLVAALILAVGAGLVVRDAFGAAAAFHPRLNLPRPALARVSPMLGHAPRRRARRVVLVIIDGLRLDSSFGLPYLDSLRRIGVDAVADSDFPTWSRPNHTTIVTGVPPIASGVRNNQFGFTVALDSLMARGNAAGMHSAFVGDIAFGLARMFHHDFQSMHYVPWRGGFEKATQLLLSQDVSILVLIPGLVDEAGHHAGGASLEYRDAARLVDQQLRDSLASLDLSRDALIITSDHGHLDRGGHGGTERVVVEVPLIMAGAGIRPGAALGEVNLVDVAPTAAALLGLPAPGHALGRTLIEALDLDDGERAVLASDDLSRSLRNQTVVDSSTAAADAVAGGIRIEHLLVVLLLTALAAVLVALGLRVLVIAVPAFPVTYYALLEVMGSRFSLSAVPDRPDALARLFDFALVAAVVQVGATFYALNGRRVLRERLAAANGLTLSGMALSWLPAGILWALYDPAVRPRLASSATLVLVPATYVAVGYFALATALTLGIEIIVFLARGLDPRQRLRRLERAAERERERLGER
jgi:hypothetical protein